MGEGTPARSEIIDPLLWRDAQLMLGRHAEPGYDDRCVWCGFRWPCPARRLAERALVVACRPHGGLNGHRTDSYRPGVSEPEPVGYRPEVAEAGGYRPEVVDAGGYRRPAVPAPDAHLPGDDQYRHNGNAYRPDEHGQRSNGHRVNGYRANGQPGRRDGREAAGTPGGGGAGGAGWNEPGRDNGSDPRPVRWRAPRPPGWSDTRPDGWDEERSRAWARSLPAGWNDTDADGRAVSVPGAGAVGSPVTVPAARDAEEGHLVGSG